MRNRITVAIMTLLVLCITIPIKAESTDDQDGIILSYHNYETGEDSVINVPDIEKNSGDFDGTGKQQETIQLPCFDLPIDQGRTYNTVSNPSSYPASCVVLIRFHITHVTANGNEDFWSFLSGAMVYNDLVLTCSHGLYNNAGLTPVFADAIYVYPGYSAATFQANATHYYVSGRYTPYQYYSGGTLDFDYDWSVLTTETAFSSSCFGYGYANGITNKSVTSMGYPDMGNFFMWETSGVMNSTSAARFSSTLSCMGGQSGAPVFDSNNIIWGIMTAYDGYYRGHGCLVTSTIYSVIMSLH